MEIEGALHSCSWGKTIGLLSSTLDAFYSTSPSLPLNGLSPIVLRNSILSSLLFASSSPCSSSNHQKKTLTDLVAYQRLEFMVDRLYGRSFWGDHEFMVVDTGGVMTFSKSQVSVIEELAITTTVGMKGFLLPLGKHIGVAYDLRCERWSRT